jgi:hypothetical protein
VGDLSLAEVGALLSTQPGGLDLRLPTVRRNSLTVDRKMPIHQFHSHKTKGTKMTVTQNEHTPHDHYPDWWDWDLPGYYREDHDVRGPRQVWIGKESGHAFHARWVGLHVTDTGEWVHITDCGDGAPDVRHITEMQAVVWLTMNGDLETVEQLVGPIDPDQYEA